MRRIVMLVLCAITSYAASGQSKLKYTVSNGVRIEGVDGTNPFIYDNDMLEDTPEDEYLWMRYSLGHVNLVGNIITRNMDQCNLGPCKYTMQQTIDQWNRVSNGIKNAGIKMLTPVVGSEHRMETPASNRIEDTKWYSSPGVDLIIREALKASKEKPLVILIGGQATTVANAYLKNPSIADRIVVLHVNGYRDAPRPRGFNTIDAWSAYVVMKNMRYVNFTGDLYGWYKGKNVNLTPAMVNSLPNNHFCNSVKSWYTRFFKVEVMADAPPILWFFQPSLWKNAVRKLDNGQTTTSDKFDYLLISENDWTSYGPALINYMKNPGNSQGTVNKPPAVNLTSPSNNTNVDAGATLNIAANASDPDGGISKVEFYRGNTKIGEDATSPYTFQLANVQEGTLTLSAKAFDNQNSSTTSASINVTVKAPNQAPSAKVTNPADNSTINTGTGLTIEATATDSDGSITKVEFYAGNTKLGEDGTQPYAYTWTNPPPGNHLITVRAIDNRGAQATSAPVKVSVNKPNTPPSIALTAPLNNASHPSGSTVTIAASAADADGSVTKVEFFHGATKLGEDVTAPFSFEWKNIPPGKYTITAKATDNVNATATSAAVVISILAPNAAPTISITAPTNQASFTAGATVALRAAAADADGSVVKVEFFNGPTKLGEDLTAPYTFDWKNVPVGSFTLSAKATDNDGSVTTSAPTTITVTKPNTPPTVKVTAPGNEAIFSAGTTVSLSATAADPDGSVVKVEFFNGSDKLGEDLTAPYNFDWKNIPSGKFSISAIAVDNDGATTKSPIITITVNTPNKPPAVSITGPAKGSKIPSGTNIVITATASDIDGSITKVEFFSGETKLGEDMNAPFTFNWNTPPSGDHTLIAKATDNTGAVSTSPAIVISVLVPAVTTVALTSPEQNAAYTSDQEVILAADVSTTYGKILKVEFFSGEKKLGEDLTMPYSYTWVNVPVGKHAIAAKAYHEQKSVNSSEPVTIEIKQQSRPVEPEPAPSALIADAGQDLQLALPQNSMTLTSASTAVNAEIVDHNWSQVSGPSPAIMAGNNAREMTINDLQEGIYIFRLTVTDNLGNTASDEIRLEVYAPLIDENIIPRYFSPNEDGINDTWEFPDHELLQNALITVFNRAGQTIFTGSAYQGTWDGTIEGQPVAPDAYFYVIRLADGRDIKGSVRIIR